PGHEAFTAMRARGAQVTDLVIIVVAADDGLMPQTKEAISHAQAAGVPIVFAINKIDVQGANPDRVKEQLAAMDLLVEDWGGKMQSHDVSAKTGEGIPELLEKVLLEAEMLDLKANSKKRALGTVVEAYLDKGRGYVSTIMVQEGTLKIGDYLLAGKNSGKIKAMFDERGHAMKTAGPSTPVSVLGLDGAPQAGDRFHVFEDEKEAKQIATKRSQLQREQSVRTQKHITLDEIGRRIALGDFKELNIILKGDVDGSVEALTDSFQKLSTEEIQVNIIHKGVGAITESDVLLASASEAIIIGFNVRPSGNARMIADKEEIDIRTYSIIYDAINDLRDAMEGMLSPEMKEEITGNVEIREVYKISKVGNIAGCMVMSGKIMRNSMIRIIRDGVVVHSGTLTALKRFKDDAKEVTKGYDCGAQIKGFNDIKTGDVIETYEEVAVKKKLK
ncbi:MAG: translation initiation factor IF-2, partial [Flavobacteriaceae bacterium]|nr:translation initiation factor IF-2 [Flavobacteriaceae bacterium]